MTCLLLSPFLAGLRPRLLRPCTTEQAGGLSVTGFPRCPGTSAPARVHTQRETVLASACRGTDDDVTMMTRETKAVLTCDVRAHTPHASGRGRHSRAAPPCASGARWPPDTRPWERAHSHVRAVGAHGGSAPAQRPHLPTTLLSRAPHETETSHGGFNPKRVSRSSGQGLATEEGSSETSCFGQWRAAPLGQQDEGRRPSSLSS